MILGLGAPTYTVLHTRLQTRLLITYYYILVPWTTHPLVRPSFDHPLVRPSFDHHDTPQRTENIDHLVIFEPEDVGQQDDDPEGNMQPNNNAENNGQHPYVMI